MRHYQVRVDIYEESNPFPIVVHLFNGKTKKEAWHYHASHLKSDVFLRVCEARGVFKGSVSCHAVIKEGWKRR